MSRTFADLGVFAAFLAGQARLVDAAAQRGLKDGAKLIQEDAKHRIGHYQEGWAQLSGATLEGFKHQNGALIPGKEELGFAPPDNPLLREGHLRDSIGVTASGDHAAVGSPEQVAVWQEMGTPNAIYPIPPRPFLGPAGFTKGEAAAKAVGEAVTKTLGGEH